MSRTSIATEASRGGSPSRAVIFAFPSATVFTEPVCPLTVATFGFEDSQVTILPGTISPFLSTTSPPTETTRPSP